VAPVPTPAPLPPTPAPSTSSEIGALLQQAGLNALLQQGGGGGGGSGGGGSQPNLVNLIAQVLQSAGAGGNAEPASAPAPKPSAPAPSVISFAQQLSGFGGNQVSALQSASAGGNVQPLSSLAPTLSTLGAFAGNPVNVLQSATAAGNAQPQSSTVPVPSAPAPCPSSFAQPFGGFGGNQVSAPAPLSSGATPVSIAQLLGQNSNASNSDLQRQLLEARLANTDLSAFLAVSNSGLGGLDGFKNQSSGG
jgi:hypothetical protein